ncbi:hypothetical protein [Agrobacterium cavarae]|uniref:hypothetical protein n=1 Tax=Agrobacterium cavarae TaxID=2528239 RepID=UPI002FFD2FAE
MDLRYLNHYAKHAQQSRERIRRSGFTMKGSRLWTGEEDEILRHHYPYYHKMLAALPHRNLSGVRWRCQKLGLKKTRHQWLASDLSKLRKLLRTEPRSVVKEQFPSHSWDAIRMVANYHGLFNETYQHRYKRTGEPMIDAVLERTEELRWTLRDLDEASGTGTYFRRQYWRQHKLKIQMIQRAVRALGGDLVVRWKDYD